MLSLPPPTKQTQYAEAGGEEWKSCGKRDGRDGRIVIRLKAARRGRRRISETQHKVCNRFPRTGCDVEEIGVREKVGIAKERAKQGRSVINIDLIGEVRRSPSKTNVTNRIY